MTDEAGGQRAERFVEFSSLKSHKVLFHSVSHFVMSVRAIYLGIPGLSWLENSGCGEGKTSPAMRQKIIFSLERAEAFSTDKLIRRRVISHQGVPPCAHSNQRGDGQHVFLTLRG